MTSYVYFDTASSSIKYIYCIYAEKRSLSLSPSITANNPVEYGWMIDMN